jgi:hypothetical protein
MQRPQLLLAACALSLLFTALLQRLIAVLFAA